MRPNRNRTIYAKPTPRRAPSRRATVKAKAASVAVCIAVAALLICWWTMWRSIDVTVNDEPASARIGMTVEEFLAENEYFGVKPGRLLSVGGNVLDESGGDRCALVLNSLEVPVRDFAATKVPEGAKLSIADGADAAEPHKEETEELAPGLVLDGNGAIQIVSQKGKAGKKAVWVGEQSGERVDHEVLEEAKDTIVSFRTPSPQGEKKYMALTFDDGPSKYTPAILDILKEKGAKATFFNLGSQASNYPDYAKRVVEEGHEMASHTNKHEYLPNLSRDDLRADITASFDSIEAASGARPTMIRAPYGAFGEECWRNTSDIVTSNILWNIDTKDWELPGAQAITDAVLSGAFNGAIALMHDGGGNREQDVAALPGIIDGLHEAGYELVTVSELMELDGTF